MEPSAVEEGFSFLDLEDCDEKDQQYLNTIIRPFGVGQASTSAKPNKPSDKSKQIVDADTRNSFKNSDNSKVSTTSDKEPNVIVSQSDEKRVYSDEAGRDRTVDTNKQNIVTTSEKETIVTAQLNASVNVALSSRSQTRVQQHPPYQSPQHPKVRPLPQNVGSPGITPYLPDAPQQIPSNQISGNTGAPVTGNMQPSFHAQPPHPIQSHHQQAYAAAAVAAANVQHTANQQTPYVFINQVTANVNVHHGPAPNGAHQTSTGTRETGGNSAVNSGSNPPQHIQHSSGVPTSLQNTHATGINPIHMQPGQMGQSTGMVPQTMTQPPPLQTNVAASLAAGGMANPGATPLMPQFMPNFPVPQMTAAPIPYNTRSGSVPPQHSTGHPNPTNIVPMQQLQQIYGYPPFFFQPNIASHVPPYPAGPMHGMPQTQIPQIPQAQLAHMAQVQQMNAQSGHNQRQGMQQPIQSQPIIIRNPLSPPAMPQGVPSINPSVIPLSQSHQKTVSGAGFVTTQRPSIHTNPAPTPLGPPHPSPQQVPHSRQTQQQPSQLNPQAPYFPHQQQTKNPMIVPAVATTTTNNGFVAKSLKSDATQHKQSYVESPCMKNSKGNEALVGDEKILSTSHDSAQSSYVSGDNFQSYESECRLQQNLSSNDEVSTQDEDEGLAFGTVDLKSLAIQEDINTFVTDDIAGSNYLNKNCLAGQANASYTEKAIIQERSFENEGNREVTYASQMDTEKEKEELVEDGRNAAEENDRNVPSDDASDLPSKAKSWASLFKSNSSGTGSVGVPTSSDSVYLSEGKLTARIQPYKENLSEAQASGTSAANTNDEAFNGKDAEMGNFLKEYSLNFRAPSIKPRGLSNRSNWCFVNAILQALVACPPFYNLMKGLPKELLESSAEQGNQSVKILRAVYHFFSEFSPLDNFPKLNRNKNKKNEDLPLGKILEPTTIYNYLLELDSDTFKVIEGRQEDAEEFLTFLLNGLNDEMIALLKLVQQQERERSNESDEGVDTQDREEDDGNDEEWREVGPRGTKSCVTRRVEKIESGSCAKSPLAEMFQGQMRSQFQHANGEPTATLQPFLTLQLDIQSAEKISNVSEAIACNFAEEAIDGYMCSKTNQEIEASRSMSLEELPPILVLHLKRFIYDGSSNGCQKLLKNIDFPVDLEISKDILSSNSRYKYPTKQRQYKLFAVVYHNGSEATKGHYVTDIYHTGLSTWLRCDDSILKTQTESMVLAHSATSVPYILFYRRGDTMVGASSQNEKERSGNKNSSANSSSTSNANKA